MRFNNLRRNWDRLASTDPKWAILTCPGTERGNWNDAAFRQTGRDDVASLMRELDAITEPVPRGRAFDFGCGIGRLTEALADYFERVDGSDISEEMIRQARTRNPDPRRISYHLNGDGLQAFPSASFDLVYSFITLQHIPRPYARQYIADFVRLLTPHGVAAFQVPYAVNRGKERIRQALPWLAAASSFFRHGVWATMEAHAIPQREIAEIVEQAGGRIVVLREGLGSAVIPSAFYYVRRARTQ